jgi:hypothetical protein
MIGQWICFIWVNYKLSGEVKPVCPDSLVSVIDMNNTNDELWESNNGQLVANDVDRFN